MTNPSGVMPEKLSEATAVADGSTLPDGSPSWVGINLFGDLELFVSGLRVDPAGGLSRERITKTNAAVLMYLAQRAGQTLPRDLLAQKFWPDSSKDRARQSLSTSLWYLRTLLERQGAAKGEILHSSGDWVKLENVRTDVSSFEELLEQAAPNRPLTERYRLTMAAADLYRDDLLPGLTQDWIQAERTRLARLYTTSLLRLAHDLYAADQPDKALECARKALPRKPLERRLHPSSIALVEYSYTYLVRLHLALGDLEDARHMVSELRDFAKLQERSIHDRLMHVSADLTYLCGSTGPDIYQKPSVTPWRIENREQPTLTGRSVLVKELVSNFRSVADAIARGERPPINLRIVKLVGVPGCGKTSVVGEVVRVLQECADIHPVFIDVADFAEPNNWEQWLSASNGMPNRPSWVDFGQSGLFTSLEPDDIDDRLDVFLRSRWIDDQTGGTSNTLLLVIENCHRIDSCNVLELLEHQIAKRHNICCVMVKTGDPEVLETGWREVPPLPAPDGSDLVELETNASARLFVSHARRHISSFTMDKANASAIAEICRLMDGNPQSLLIAASRAVAFTPQELRDNLRARLISSSSSDDSPLTAADAAQWSLRLLPADMQDFYAKLSVLECSWTAALARKVTGYGDSVDSFISHLYFECHLLERMPCDNPDDVDEIRWYIPDRLRPPVSSLAAEADRKEILRLHAEHCLEFVTDIRLLRNLGPGEKPGLERPAHAKLLRWLDAEHRSILFALSSTFPKRERQRPSANAGFEPDRTARLLGLRLVCEMWWYWYHRSHMGILATSLARLEAAFSPKEIEAECDKDILSLFGEAYYAAGLLNLRTTRRKGSPRLSIARRYLTKGLQVANRSGDNHRIGRLWNGMGWYYEVRAEEHLKTVREGSLAEASPDCISAREAYRLAIRHLERAGDEVGLVWPLHGTGRLCRRLFDIYQQQYNCLVSDRSEHFSGIVASLQTTDSMATTIIEEVKVRKEVLYQEADQCFNRALVIALEQRDHRPAYILKELAHLECGAGNIGVAWVLVERALTILRPLSYKVAIANVTEEFVRLAHHRNNEKLSLQLLGTMYALRFISGSGCSWRQLNPNVDTLLENAWQWDSSVLDRHSAIKAFRAMHGDPIPWIRRGYDETIRAGEKYVYELLNLR